MGNVIENNNSLMEFYQIWPSYIYTDVIPLEPPKLSDADAQGYIEQGKTSYHYYIFNKVTDNATYPYLMYVEKFKLTKEFRQGRSWKFELNGEEENIRRIVFPGVTTSRNYTPQFYLPDAVSEIPFASVDPIFDIKECRIDVALDYDELYFSGWVYVGKSLAEIIQSELTPPFDSKIWILKDPKTGYRTRFDITQKDKVYSLPQDDPKELPDFDMLVSTNTFNWVANLLGVLDEGEYWS